MANNITGAEKETFKGKENGKAKGKGKVKWKGARAGARDKPNWP